MSGLLYPDLVNFTKVTIGATYHEETKGTPYESEALVEEDNSVRYGPNGEELDPQIFIMAPGSSANLGLKRGDYVTIKRMHGVTITDNDRKIRRVSLVGSVEMSHIELVVEGGGR